MQPIYLSSSYLGQLSLHAALFLLFFFFSFFGYYTRGIINWHTPKASLIYHPRVLHGWVWYSTWVHLHGAPTCIILLQYFAIACFLSVLSCGSGNDPWNFGWELTTLNTVLLSSSPSNLIYNTLLCTCFFPIFLFLIFFRRIHFFVLNVLGDAGPRTRYWPRHRLLKYQSKAQLTGLKT